ncbi:DUF5719 family protein [Streptomyces sp. bgisy022]|uniref:DUF5719 family protein n=1 Tax=Streptomyces sp. bgisy022 TaxID=3413769 RepID=UPI003D74860C
MNRPTLSLIAVATALAAVTGVAALTAPEPAADTTAATAARRLPVERSSLLCPAPSTSDLAETTYTSFTPATDGTGDQGAAELRPAGAKAPEKDPADREGTEDTEDTADEDGNGEQDGTAGDGSGDETSDDGKSGDGKSGGKDAEPVLKPKEPGKPVTGDATGGEAPALVGTAEGRFAPGWTLQQTTEVAAGTGRGLQGVACTAPDTEFWFPGASTGTGRTDYVHLTNPDDSAAVVDIELYGKDGALETVVDDGITVQPHSTEPVLLSTLTEAEETDVTVHVVVRSGRVGASVQALDDALGGDWLAASADPAGSLVLPGLPEDATAVRLVLFTPGDTDADLKVRLASPSGPITPAGHETVQVKAGMTTAVDLGEVTRGEAGSLLLTPADRSVPVVAAVRVLRGEGDDQESAFIPAARPVGARATAAGNTAKGTVLAVTAPEGNAKVTVTASAGSEGGSPESKTFTIKSGTTQHLDGPVPSGLKGTYALTVEPEPGAAPVYASRTLTAPDDGVPAFTVQPLPDDRGLVAVPRAEEDLSVLQR